MSGLHQVEGKTFLITGGASGLGAGYVEFFLKDGAKAVAILDINEEVGKAYAEKLNKVYPGKVIFVKCDISSEASLTAAFEEVVSKFGSLDVIINNAGIMNDAPHIWRKASDLNYNGVVSLTLKGLQHMSKLEGGKGGTIINISSVAAYLKIGYLPIYAGAKCGVLHFTNSIASGLEEEKEGVRLMTMCFGTTNTPLIQETENKGYNSKYKHLLALSDDNIYYKRAFEHVQKAESAVKGVVDAFKQGYNGSVWLATNDRPVQDITPAINKAYEIICKEIYSPFSQE